MWPSLTTAKKDAAWFCLPCAFERDRDYRAPAAPDVHCSACGGVANPCELLRVEMKALRGELTAMTSARTADQARPANGEVDTMTAGEAVTYLRLPSIRALYQAVRRGQVPVHRLGSRRMRFYRAELDALLARR
ncbi:helix-turn-helix domain-containing protein [Anaeromyxobacter sp. SG66]|uniref:helix-turn-helix domain-containing protein n=1 Tax=Anaeromyxobacter sp. SG66 TaxID=2925410 RepID=UPI001F593D5D|nr:helix-turn-helix domain-containing protein [Anaeromyxobacter sp. SG66]